MPFVRFSKSISLRSARCFASRNSIRVKLIVGFRKGFEKNKVQVYCTYRRFTGKVVNSLNNKFPDRPSLYHAIANDNIQGVADEYCHGTDLRLSIDDEGNTPLHVAYQFSSRRTARFLLALHFIDQPWLIPNEQGIRPLDMAKDEILDDLLSVTVPPTDEHDEHEAVREQNTHLMDRCLQNAHSNPPKILISLDGGGVKGVSQVMMLQEIKHHLLALLPSSFLSKHPLTSPLSLADWVAGTSIGAVVGIGLMEKKKDNQTTVTLDSGMQRIVSTSFTAFAKRVRHPERRAAIFEHCYTSMYGNQNMDDIAQKYFCTATDGSTLPATLRLFRNYVPEIAVPEQNGYEDSRKMKIVDALMATSAAPFFVPTHHGLSDGGVIMKNPTLALLREFYRFQRIEKSHGKNNTDSIGLLVSIGSGLCAPKPTSGICFGNATSRSFYLNKGALHKYRNLMQLFLTQSTTSDTFNLEQAEEWCLSHGTPFYRLNPPNVNDLTMNCTTAEELTEFMWGVLVWLRRTAFRDTHQIAEYMVKLVEWKVKHGHI